MRLRFLLEPFRTSILVQEVMVVLRKFLFSYNKNSDEYSVKINKNSDDNPWQVYIYSDE